MGFRTSTNNHFEVLVELIQNHFELALKKKSFQQKCCLGFITALTKTLVQALRWVSAVAFVLAQLNPLHIAIGRLLKSQRLTSS